MTDFRERYKRLGFGREDVDFNRALRSQQRNDQRHEKRSEFYGTRRDLEQRDSIEVQEQEKRKNSQSPGQDHDEAKKKDEEKIDEGTKNRLRHLERWREERNRRKLLEKKVAKPVFKVGVVHHRLYSPPVTKTTAPSPSTKLCRLKENVPEPQTKRVTNATKKRLEIKAMRNQKIRENMRSKKKKESIQKIPLAPKDHQFKAPTGINAIPLFGRRALEFSQENEQSEFNDSCATSRTDFPANVSSLCKVITDFTLSLNNSSMSKSLSVKALNRSQKDAMDQSCEALNKSKKDEEDELSETLNENKNNEMNQENEEEKCEEMDVEDQLPQTVNRRRSTRIFNDSMIKKPQTPPTTRKMRANFNLLDSSLSNLNEIGSPSMRRTTRFSKMTENGVDQSLIKFSPRQSMRLAKEAEQSLPSKETTEYSLLKEIVKSSSPEEDVKSLSPGETACTSFLKSLSPEKPPVHYSPFVVSSRGKDSVRKELKKSRNSLALKDIPTKDTVMKNLNISVEEEERTAQYYKYLLSQEIERLNELCDSWEVVKNDESTPEDIHYLIQAAIGQTQLLINKKFKRFESLVQDCETGRGEMLVTCKDLQGFWEMTFIEVENCNDRFKKLEDLRAANWVDEEAKKNEEKLKKKPAVKKSVVNKKKPALGKSSSIRAHILAARKKKQGLGEDVEMAEPKTLEQEEVNKQLENTTPKKTPTRNAIRTSTPGSNSLLRKVHLSQTRKSSRSPLITMKINKLCKTPEVHLDESIVYINSDRTPARGILKPYNNDIATASAAKSENKVLFKEQPMEIKLFDADSERLENISELEEVSTVKKLNFEDSLNENENKKDDTDRQSAKSETDDTETEYKTELYLSSRGIVCERLIPVIKIHQVSSPPKLKQKNSMKSAENSNLSTTETATPSRQLRRDSKKPAENHDLSTSEPATPSRQLRRNSKKPTENNDSSTTEAATPSRQLRRNSKKPTENDYLSISETATPSRQRRRNSKKPTENYDLSINKPTTPKSQRKINSKKPAENHDLSTAEAPLTPNSIRRSLRLQKLHDKSYQEQV